MPDRTKTIHVFSADSRERRTRKMVCSRCGESDRVPLTDMLKRTRLRCPKCGGPLNKPSQA
jgi:DNA-directed RNA polymerase subunit RPC12/RpoP